MNETTNFKEPSAAQIAGSDMLCEVCHSDELPLSEIKGYEHVCIGCECEIMDQKLESKWNDELSIYEQRTGQKLDFNEFYYECFAGKIDKSNLNRLPELKSCYEDAMMNLKFSESEDLKNKQLSINFENDGMPF